MKRKRLTEEQIIAVLLEHEADAKAGALAREHWISEARRYGLFLAELDDAFSVEFLRA